MTAMISAQALTKTFGKVRALAGVSLDVEAGTVYGLLGPNGSGKSTLLRILCGLQQQDSGAIRLSVDHAAIGYVSQEASLYEDLSLRENLEFFARAHDLRGADARAAIEARCAELGLTGRFDTIAGTLSRGWQQRVALACSLLHSPRLLLLDEPTAGLDPVARRDIWNLLRSCARAGVAILLTTHHLDEAERCDVVGYMNDGRILTAAAPRDLMAEAGCDHLEDALVTVLQGVQR
jgi:ABC-2 type transport system ATP-binding protein